MDKPSGIQAYFEGTSLKRLIITGFIGFITISSFILLLTSYEMKYRFASSTIHNWLTNFSSESLIYVMGMENRYFTTILPEESEPPNFSSVAFEFATSIKPGDIRSLLGRELPGFALYDAEIYVAGEGTDYTSLPIESSPPMEVLLAERKASLEQLEKYESENEEVKPPAMTTGDKNVVFIYHSHSSESYLPHLEGVKNPNHAHHSKVNITMVGKKFSEELKKRGIGAQADETNIMKKLNERGLKFGSSYRMSREVVQSAMASDKNLAFFFDFHRDSQRRDKTTVTINGKPYSRLFFVIGKANKNYEENLQFAKKLNEKLEKKYPGLSRGIITKDKSQGNGIYNQDLSDRSALLEVGGVDNTMEENFRTAAALADVFSEYYWDGEKVSNK